MPGDSPLPLLDAALRGALIALLALLAVNFWRERSPLPAARAGCLLAVGLCDYAVTTAPEFPSALPLALQVPMMAIANGNPVLFWVFARALLDDDFQLRAPPVLAWLVLALLGGLACGLPSGPLRAAWGPVIGIVLAASPLVFGALVMAATVAQWRGDLVEQRRRLRAFIVIGGTGYLVASALARILGTDDGRFSATPSLFDMFALTAVVATIAWRLLRLGPSELWLTAPVADTTTTPDSPGETAQPKGAALAALRAPLLAPLRAPLLAPLPSQLPGPLSGPLPAPLHAPLHAPNSPSNPTPDRAEPPGHPDPADRADPVQARLAGRLAQLMGEERAYRDEDLGIAWLATRLAVPEYRLRRLINQHLGHRNFSAYVNQYRLAEAMRALADPAQSDRPVLTIALDAGFQSIGPFNRAFKSRTGLTPTEFRRKHQADSGNG